MNIASDVFECKDAEQWNRLISTNHSASAYHLWEWGEALVKTYGYRKHYLAIARNNEFDGVFPLIYIKSQLFGTRLISLPFCEYGGMILRSELAPEETEQTARSLLSASAELARNAKAEYVEVREPQSLTENLQAAKYNQSQQYVTFRIDLTKGKEQLWKCLDKKTRNAVRKAEKSGLTLKTTEEAKQLKDYFGLYLQTQKRLGSPPHSYRLFQNLFETFSKSGKVSIRIGYYKQRPIAGVIVFMHNGRIFWWNNAADARYRRLDPTNLLLWNIIEWGAEKDFHVMDMGRTRKDTTIYHFKSGWGGNEVPIHDYVCFLTQKKRNLPDPSQMRFRYLSKAWSRLPISLSQRIGPKIVSGIGL
jgi:FemAB-related protein (PEP-CTERM system-associated)